MFRTDFRLPAAVLALLLSAGAASASSMTGEQLLALCTANMNGSGNPMASAECMGFVVGVADTFDCIEDNHGLKWNSAAAVTQPQLVRLVVHRIQSDPVAQADEGHKVVAEVLSSQFPCPAKTAGN